MTIALLIIALAVLQRAVELIYAECNTRRLLARGAVEAGKGHYPLMIALHAGWLAAIVIFLPPGPPIHLLPLAIFIVLQALRVWVIATLGPYWTTRIVSLPGAPLVRRGPYRFLRHPNYVIVTGEIAALPLVFGEIVVAIVFTALNLALLFWRVRIEDMALDSRRGL